jgi:glycosyltransferase involved in cell wall biosynthesis
MNQIRKKILHVCKVYSPVKGGVQIVVERLAMLLQNSYESHILTTHKAATIVENVKHGSIVRCRAQMELFSLPVSTSFMSKFFCNSEKVDYVVCHCPFPLTDLCVLLWRKKINNLIVYWHSDVVSQRFLGFLLRPLTKILLSEASNIIVSNPVMLENSMALSRYKHKCSIIPIGFNPDDRAKNSIQDEGYFLFVGRHVPYKGVNVLLEAVERSRVRLVIVGDGPLFHKNEELAERLDLGEKVQFIKQADDLEVQKLLARCRALVLPSIIESEAFGMVQIEAMAYSKPVINTRLKSGVPWVARHGFEAITVQPNNVKALSDALTEMNSDKFLREKLALGAHSRWQACFSLSRMEHSFRQVLQDA